MSHPTNISFTISLVTQKYCFFITPIHSLDHLMNFPNHVPQVIHVVSVKFLPTLVKILSPIPNTPYSYRLAHSVGDFLMISHCRCKIDTLFLRYNLKVAHANPIPTSSFHVKGPRRRNQPSNPNYSLAIIPIFLIMVRFPLL